MRNAFSKILLSVLLCVLAACGCEEPAVASSEGIVFNFIDTSGGNIYDYFGTEYSKDSLKVFEDGTVVPVIFEARNGVIIPSIYDNDDDLALREKICKNFIVRFKYHEENELQVCYKVNDYDCGSEFKSLEIFWDQVSVYTTAYTTNNTVPIEK